MDERDFSWNPSHQAAMQEIGCIFHHHSQSVSNEHLRKYRLVRSFFPPKHWLCNRKCENIFKRKFWRKIWTYHTLWYPLFCFKQRDGQHGLRSETRLTQVNSKAQCQLFTAFQLIIHVYKTHSASVSFSFWRKCFLCPLFWSYWLSCLIRSCWEIWHPAEMLVHSS